MIHDSRGKAAYFVHRTPFSKAYYGALRDKTGHRPSRRGFRRAADAITYGKNVHARYKHLLLGA